MRITVPGDDHDELLDDELQRWSRDLESDYGQILDFDERPGGAPGACTSRPRPCRPASVDVVRHGPEGT